MSSKKRKSNIQSGSDIWTMKCLRQGVCVSVCVKRCVLFQLVANKCMTSTTQIIQYYRKGFARRGQHWAFFSHHIFPASYWCTGGGGRRREGGIDRPIKYTKNQSCFKMAPLWFQWKVLSGALRVFFSNHPPHSTVCIHLYVCGYASECVAGLCNYRRWWGYWQSPEVYSALVVYVCVSVRVTVTALMSKDWVYV